MLRFIKPNAKRNRSVAGIRVSERSEEHTSELQSRFDLVCRLLLEKKKKLLPRHPSPHIPSSPVSPLSPPYSVSSNRHHPPLPTHPSTSYFTLLRRIFPLLRSLTPL